MNRDEVIERASACGLTVKACEHPELMAIRLDQKPDDPNERMRMTASGAMLTVGDDGNYWQVGTVEDVANYVRGLQ